MNRDKVIVKTSILGVIVNILLVVFKASVGLIANSIAIILDAVNNLSDALSQLITIVGTKLSARRPNPKHPYGYGRIEYISSVVVSALILVAGVTSAKESIEKIIEPGEAEYSTISFVILGAAVIVKFVMGRYTKRMGEKVQANALIAAGTESLMDCVLSLSTIVAAVINRFYHISLEGILGLILALFIIKAGYEILMESLSSIIGDRVDSELSKEIKNRIRQRDGVNGAYDLVLHDYGPSRSIGTVHIEVDDSLSAKEIYQISRRITADIYNEYGIVLTVGIYASNTTNELAMEIKKDVESMIAGEENILQSHGFYVDEEEKYIVFDLLISFHAPSAKELADRIRKQVEKQYSGYQCNINIDHDFSD